MTNGHQEDDTPGACNDSMLDEHIARIIEAGQLIDQAGICRDGFEQFAELDRLLSYMLPHAEAALECFARLKREKQKMN